MTRARPAQTLAFDLRSLDFDSRGAPRIEVDLTRDGPRVDPPSFAPLRMPEGARLTLGGPLHDTVVTAELSLEATLQAGSHALPLGAGVPALVDVAEGSSAQLRLGLGRGSAGAELQLLEVTFEPALRLSNLVGVGSALLPQLEERLGSLELLWRWLPEPLRVACEVAAASADLAVAFELRGLSLSVHRDGGEALLQPALAGSLRLFDRATLPLDNLPLPKALWPRLPAALVELAEAPLLEALLELFDEERRAALLSVGAGLVGGVEGRISARLLPPAFSLGYRTGDGTRRQIDIALTEAIEVEGDFSGQGRGRTLGGEASLVLRSEAGEGRLETSFEAELAAPSGGDQTAGAGWTRLLPGLEHASVLVDLAEDSQLPTLEVALWQENPLCRGRGALELQFAPLTLDGMLRLDITPERVRPRIERPARLRAQLLPESSRLLLDQGDVLVDSALDGALELTLDHHRQGLRWTIDFDGELSHEIDAELTPIAELGLKSGRLHGTARSKSRLKALPTFRLLHDNATRVDLDGTRFSAQLLDFELELDGRRLTIPAGSELATKLRKGGIAPTGPLPLVADLSWDLHGEPCLLHFDRRSVSLLTDELRAGELTLHLDEGGKLSFSGDRTEGLYGARYFNALLSPAKDLAAWHKIFQSDDAIRHVVDALSFFSTELAEAVTDLRQLVLTAREILRREGIKEPKDFVPRPVMARIFSLLLVGSDRLQTKLEPILRQATEGTGLPLAALKHLLQRELAEFEIDYELNVLLNWLHLVLRAGEPYGPAEAQEELPLVLDGRFCEALAALPAASEIYARIESGAVDQAFAERLAELATELSLQQLDYLVTVAEPARWGEHAVARLRYVRDVKRRVARIGEGYGGVEHATQPYGIGAFIGEAVGPLPGINCAAGARDPAWPPPCALGVEEIATLLQAGLAMVRQDQRAELNNRLLLELLRRRPPELTREVLIELGHQSPRALTGILFAFLEQDQDQLTEPIDLVAFLSDALGLEIPLHRDFLAGGRRARESYYEALNTLAERIIADGDGYLARKQHLQEARQPLLAPLVLTEAPTDRREREAIEAIEAADALGASCRFSGKGGGPRKRAEGAYRKAFARCAELLEAEPRAFQRPWFRPFWARNEAALRVLYSVRAYQEDLDDVRAWLAVQRPGKPPESEQALVEAFVEALFYEPATQAALLADPLVRLLIDPEPGHYDFTIISCMGVITEGQDGSELEDAFRRLTQRRGVRVVRTATGTGRSLEYNAQRIIEAIETCQGPWGIIGYSQGCANALLAEHLLYGGTPPQQKLVQRLVCRNLLFSAANGSAHGSSAMEKFTRAMVAGEHILKHYQATLSWDAIRIALRALRAGLDSPAFIDGLGGGDSLSFERAHVLHRDGQFLPHVPTSHSRAVVEEDRLPEFLEYMYYCLKEMTGGEPQDTQVLITDAIGQATRVANDYTRVLARCDMGSPVLASHHWAPLTKEISFIKTERDRQLAIYEGPKDHLVRPWVEVNARFGRIHSKRVA